MMTQVNTEPTPIQDTDNPTCMTGVNPPRRHGVGVLGGRRVVWGVRVDKDLKNRVQPKIRHYWGSDCRAFETWLMAWEVAYDEMVKQREAWVNPGNTSVVINGLSVVRAQAPRRKLAADDPLWFNADRVAVVTDVVNRLRVRVDVLKTYPERRRVLDLLRDYYPDCEGEERKLLADEVFEAIRDLRKAEASP